ncbi:hypothetical protein ACE3NQ_07140 [Paenibacillus terreus]|uniref:DUF4367 domain-containing protein n=1 Tax=Paenibacillus terreus TaxID=1387834 RepID=A0ABV5B594_9BACL
MLDKEQELKSVFRDPRIPETDFSGKVMEKLHTGQRPKRFSLKYKAGLLIMASMLLTVSTAFGAVKYFSLKNRQGEVLYEVKPLKEAPNKKVTEEERKRAIRSRELGDELLKAGMAALIYVVPNNPNHELDTRFKPINFNNLSALRAKMAKYPVKIPDSILGKYQFKAASVYFDPVTEVNPPSPEEKAAIVKKLQQQAKLSGKDYAMMPIELSDKLISISVVYKNGKDEVMTRIGNIGAGNQLTGYIDEKIHFDQEKLVINGAETMYTTVSGNPSTIEWVVEAPENGLRYAYMIHSNKGNLTKEQLIEIARSYLK